MPRRKKLPAVPDYNGVGKEPDNLLVQKSNPLVSLSETGLTLAEFKILDAYLGRINSHDPEKRFIRLEKGEIERLLGVSQIKPDDLEKRVKNLFQTIKIKDNSKRNGFTLIALFEKAECYQDEDGLWQVDLGASPSAMEYIFNPDRLGYLRYNLRNVVKLTSRYSYVLFLYLEQNRHKHLSWEIPLDELKALLRCTADTYTQFKRFNDLVLKKCHEELNEKTDCKYSYEPLKRGRAVKAVRFTLETIADILPEVPDELEGQQQLPWFDKDINDPLSFLSSACGNEFSREQMEVIFTTICLKKLEHPEGVEMARFHYLQRKYALLNLRAANTHIPHRFDYFKAMLENDN